MLNKFGNSKNFASKKWPSLRLKTHKAEYLSNSNDFSNFGYKPIESAFSNSGQKIVPEIDLLKAKKMLLKCTHDLYYCI